MMIFFAILAVLAVAGIVATIHELGIDGYRRRPTLANSREPHSR
ncbi:MAG: hypothetical protein ABJB03_00315 [Rhodoglobus sp.]